MEWRTQVTLLDAQPATWMAAIGVSALAPAAGAAAQIYFHKPAVARASFEEDVATCRDLVEPVKTPRQSYTYSQSIYATAAASFLAGLMGSKERRHVVDNVLRTCMADKGYRRVEMDEALEKQLRDLDDMPRLERLFALASAEQPNGKMLPR